MKKYILLVLFNLLSSLIVAQTDIRLNNYWANAHFINPSTIYDKYLAVFSMAARKQWVGFPGAPSTYFASGTTYQDKYHMQLGLIVVQDKIGYTSVTDIDLSYAYAILLQRDWQLHLGLGLNNQSLNYEIGRVEMTSDDNEYVFGQLDPQNKWNADLGMEVTNKSLRIGASSQNIFSIFNHDNRLKTNTNYLYARYRQRSSDIINMGLGICGIQYNNMYQMKSSLYQMEFNLTGYFKLIKFNGLTDKPDLFDLGVYYRTGNEIGAIFNFNDLESAKRRAAFGEFGVIFGFDLTESMHVSYSYDYHLGGISRSSLGTNELMLTYNLFQRPVCKNCWH